MSAPGAGNGAGGWRRRRPEDRTLGALLRWSTRLAGAALALAVAVAWLGPDAEAAGEAGAAVGVAMLLAAPFLATLAAAVSFARRGHGREAALAALLLALLLAGAWLGLA